MKKIILALLLTSNLTSFAQIDVSDITKNVRDKDMLVGLPKQRVSTSTPLTLTDQWQTVGFVSGSNALDGFSFPQSRWDFTNQKLLANPLISLQQGYEIRWDMSFTNVTGMSKIQVRFVIPSPTPFYFPYPNSSTNSFVDVGTISINGEIKNITFDYDLYTGDDFRTYGMQIQIRALSYTQNSNLITGLVSQVLTVLTGSNRVTLNNSSLNIYSK